MRRRTSVVCLLTAGLGLAVLAGGCGGSRAVTEPEPIATGNAVLQGTLTGAGEGVRVAAVGTAVSTEVDEDGQFLMSSLPAGSATLRFEGGGVDARLEVQGLQDGLVTSIAVRVSGASAELSAPATCTPDAQTYFSGRLDQMNGTRLVVAGRAVDASQVQKVWRGNRRIDLSELIVGEKVKVWGVLRGDGVVLADEIVALTSGSETWVDFTGRVESVSAAGLGSSGVHADPNGGYFPTVVVAGRTVRTSSGTKFRWSDGSVLDPREIKAGQTAHVQGWKKDDGTVSATSFKVDGSGGPVWVSFRGRVDSVSVSALVHGNPYTTYVFVVAGRKVKTDGSTVFKWSDGTVLSPSSIVVGDQALVEGWSKPEGYVLATKMVVDKR